MSTCSLESGAAANRVCAGDAEKDTCSGDSGGPLSVSISGQYRLYGITSYGGSSTCGQAPLWGVYTKVSGYTQWINDAKNGNFGAPPPPPPGIAAGILFSMTVGIVAFFLWM